MFDISLNVLLSSLLFLLHFRLNLKYFAFMVDFHLPLKHLIIYEILTVCKKYLMRDLCVISCGLTPMTVVVGVYHPEEQDTLLAKYYLLYSAHFNFFYLTHV